LLLCHVIVEIAGQSRASLVQSTVYVEFSAARVIVMVENGGGKRVDGTRILEAWSLILPRLLFDID
jgi:hypothetical protein